MQVHTYQMCMYVCMYVCMYEGERERPWGRERRMPRQRGLRELELRVEE